ncbi:MAG: hypothetical protein IPN76_28675 [Saprospiraceae bacterium]|jgi:hypothetical protein|nr:hypothetical protein [Saprospiraceae bacterium]
MIKILAFVFACLPSAMNLPTTTVVTDCSCPSISNLQKTFQSSGSVAFNWSAASGATQYKLWYVRESDGFTSSYSYTTNTSFNYSGLAVGQYDFYFQTVCNGEGSSFTGWEDTVIF